LILSSRCAVVCHKFALTARLQSEHSAGCILISEQISYSDDLANFWCAILAKLSGAKKLSSGCVILIVLESDLKLRCVFLLKVTRAIAGADIGYACNAAHGGAMHLTV
jgi:hypothetical protein